MPKSVTRPLATASALSCAVIIVASAIRFASDLDGPAGFVFFLLIMVAPIFIGAGVAVTVWRLTLLLPPAFGVVERLLFAMAGFVATCGCGPLIISMVVMTVTRHEGTLGAAGLWAFISIAISGALCVFGCAVTVLRLALYRRKIGSA